MTLAFNGKSRARRTWLLAAALLAVVAGIGGTVMLNRTDTRADTTTITFDAPYTLGNINGQDGWSKTGPYDVAVVSMRGGKRFASRTRVTSGSLGDQTFSQSLRKRSRRDVRHERRPLRRHASDLFRSLSGTSRRSYPARSSPASPFSLAPTAATAEG